MGCKCCKNIVQNIEKVYYFQFCKETSKIMTEIMTPFPKSRYYLIAVLWERCRKNNGCRMEITILHPFYPWK